MERIGDPAERARLLLATLRTFLAGIDDDELPGLLYALGPTSRAEWFCLLADRAAERGDGSVAAHRYDVAERFGGKDIRDRLERKQAIAAYQRLLAGARDADELRGPGELGPYRQLVLATAAVMRGSASWRHRRMVEEDAAAQHLQQHCTFLAAVELLREGEQGTPRRLLRKLCEAPSTDSGLAVNARLIIGVIDGDDRLIADAARNLLSRYGRDWPDRALVARATLLTAVARADPALLAELVAVTAGATNTRFTTQLLSEAAALLARAAQAAVFSQPDETYRLVDEARNLLAGVDRGKAGELREKADRICVLTTRLFDNTTPERPLDRLAYAALHRAGVSHACTPEALRLWREQDARSGGDYRTLHHLAVAEHALAYQLEIDGDQRAPEQWRAALSCWARLFRDTHGFWQHMRSHLSVALPDSTPDEVARAVEEARAELPAQLLEPHVTRTIELRQLRLPSARAHVELIRTAAFDFHHTAAARTRIVREAATRIRRLLRAGQLDQAMHEARAWTTIDADNVLLAELLIDVGLDLIEEAIHQQRHGWAEFCRPMLEHIADVTEPIREGLNLGARYIGPRGRPKLFDSSAIALADKLARFDFWLGTCLLLTSSERVRVNRFEGPYGFRIAVIHLRAAIVLGLPAIEPYGQAPQLLADAERIERTVPEPFTFFRY